MELSNLQKKIVETTEDNVIVLSAAASGKTRVLTERVHYLLENGADPNKIVVFTFTNAAAEEMKKRIGDQGKNCFINTVHSYAYYLLMKNGIDTSSAINEEDFDEFFRLIKQNPYVIEEVDYLLLDEAQDSNKLQFEFILEMIKPKSLFIVGDLRQSIYEFNGAKPEIFLDLIYDSKFTTYNLNENYRNAPAILTFAKRLISGSLLNDYDLYDDSICMNEEVIGSVNEVEYLPSRIISLIEEDPQYGNWFILTRNNEQLDDIIAFLKKANIPCDTFKKSQISSDEFKQKMADNTVKVLTVHAAKGLEADNVMVIGVAKKAIKAEERRVAYVAATRARKKLIWMHFQKKKKKVRSWE